VLAPHAMVAELVAMVGPEGDNRVVGFAGCFESGDELAYERIDVADACEIGMEGFASDWFWKRALVWHAAETMDVAPVTQCEVGSALRRERVGGERQGGAVVEVPVSLGCVEGRVGLLVAHEEKERRFRFCRGFQLFDCGNVGESVAVGIVVDVGTFKEGNEFVGRVIPVDTRLFIFVSRGCVLVAFYVELRLAPGLRVALSVVEDFTEAVSFVSVFFEKLWQGCGIREVIPKMSFIVVGFGCVGAAASEHAGTRRPADCVLAVGAFEERTASGETIDVWRVDVLGSVAVELGP